MSTGVLPVNEVKLEVNTVGRITPGTFVEPLDITSIAVTLDDGIEEWNPLDMKGWVRRLKTVKSLTVSCDGKRNYGNPGNDYLAGLMLSNGAESNSIVKLTFPDTSVLSIPCVIDVKSVGGGASTDVAELNIEFLSDGKPTYTAAL